MAILGFDEDEIARLLALLEAEQWDELELEEEGRLLRLLGPYPEPPAVPTAPPADTLALPTAGVPEVPPPDRGRRPKRLPAAKNLAAPKVAEKPAAPPANQIALVAPMVGIFYRADKPGAPPFISVGDHISVGQTVGVIEAMKIFSEIPAEHAGIVVAIPAKDGQLVQTGEPLILLQKLE
ncbi:MAG TPA: biotin/lipoyl-containing protein [Chthonomonadaceae bacterium]|nr:biotin/lipoyl-containing protein [Chthonomonadaceae bacterium]